MKKLTKKWLQESDFTFDYDEWFLQISKNQTQQLKICVKPFGVDGFSISLWDSGTEIVLYEGYNYNIENMGLLLEVFDEAKDVDICDNEIRTNNLEQIYQKHLRSSKLKRILKNV